MNETTTQAKPRPKRRILKTFGIVALVATVALGVAHWIWTGSGSNDWQLAIDEGGIKVWTLKAPGTPLVKVKAHARVKAPMAGMVRLLEDLDSCVDAQCYDAKMIERLPTEPGRYAAYVRFKFDVPGFGTQDYVLFQQRQQDPVTKKLDMSLLAAPGRIPRDDCCVRVTHLYNTWAITPLDDGLLDIEFVQDTDAGGLPYVLANWGLKQGTYDVMHGMQDLMNKERYRDAKLDEILELTAR